MYQFFNAICSTKSCSRRFGWRSGVDQRLHAADPSTIPGSVDGKKYQIALLLKPTPLSALEDLGKSNEVMPQKSTYFFPKLATGMILNPLYPAG